RTAAHGRLPAAAPPYSLPCRPTEPCHAALPPAAPHHSAKPRRAALPTAAPRHTAAQPATEPLPSYRAVRSPTAPRAAARAETCSSFLVILSNLVSVMATFTVRAFDPEGRPIEFESWLEDLHLYLQNDTRDDFSLADSPSCTQWTVLDAAATLAIHNHLSPDQRVHFRQVKSAHAFYTGVVKRYSSPSSTTLGRLALPYLFPELSDFTTVAGLMTHLHSLDTRYRGALLPEFLATNHPPMYLTLYFLVTRLPDTL
ncbi:unnamed protein product, partial [Closterium sp. NIES-54]